MLANLGWIVAAFLGGFLLADALRRRRPGLKQRFGRIDSFQGMRYGQILQMIHQDPLHTSRRKDGVTLRQWCDRDYSITLAFDEQDICLGVDDERG